MGIVAVRFSETRVNTRENFNADERRFDSYQLLYSKQGDLKMKILFVLVMAILYTVAFFVRKHRIKETKKLRNELISKFCQANEQMKELLAIYDIK